MIFTDTYNSKDFSDPMTLSYGHHMKDGTMFAGLHAFGDSNFFKGYHTVRLYMDDKECYFQLQGY